METFAIRFGVNCTPPDLGKAPCHPFYVGYDNSEASCHDCGATIDLTLFRIANRTIIIGIELLDDDSLHHLGFGFAAFAGDDDDRSPAELVAGKDYDPILTDFSISEVNCKRDYRWMRFVASPDFTRDTALFSDVFTHATHPLAGEEYLPQGYLAPLLAGVQLWNTAYLLARHNNIQVWPLFDGEIWHGEPDAV